MFVGWEGSFMICPKWLSQSDYSILSFMFFFVHTSRPGDGGSKKPPLIFFQRQRRAIAALHHTWRVTLILLKKGGDGYKPFDEKLNPYFISGFADAESCFSVSILEDKRQKIG